MKINQFENSIDVLNMAGKIYKNKSYYKLLSNNYEILGQYKNAEKMYLMSHYITPVLFKPQESILDFYIRNNNEVNAKQWAHKILNSKIKIESNEVLRIRTKAENYLKGR